MKKIQYIYGILFLIIFPLFQVIAQKKGEDPYKGKTTVRKAKKFAETGDKYFKTYEYFLAAQEYAQAVGEDPDYLYALYYLAESYRLYFNYSKALSNYKKVIDKDSAAYPFARYWYASMLKNDGQYEEAIAQFEAFLQAFPESAPSAAPLKEKVSIDLAGCKLALNELKKPVRNYSFSDLPAPVNSGNSDYSPSIYKNDTSLVLSSARAGTIGDKDFGMLGGKYTDNFRFNKGTDSSWTEDVEPDNFKVVNSAFNESAGSFTGDKRKFYFTRCGDKSTSGKVDAFTCSIYVTALAADNTWGEPVKLNENVNMEGEWNAQPNISPTGDTLFFVSKRPGGKGKHDIYMSTSLGDDNWSPAHNLEAINTPSIDMTPFYYSKEKTLFFATNGREGFGGLDIFKATGSNFDSVSNIGLPFNSNMDDFYFLLGDKKGYLASNREGGKGNDDIYLFNIKSSEAIIAEIKKDSLLAMAARDSSFANGSKELKSISITGKLLHEDTKEPAFDVESRLKDKNGKVLKTTKTNKQGDFKFDNLPVADYKVEVEDKDSRLTSEVKYSVDGVNVKGSKKEVSKVPFENIYFDFDKYKLRREARKTLNALAAYYKKNPEIQIEMYAGTDSYGTNDYNKNLSKNRGKASLAYLIKKGVDKASLVVNALGETAPIASNSSPAGRQLNRRVEFYILGGKGYEAKAMTYIVDPNASLEEVARQFNMSVDALKELNGMETNDLEAYQPLRVRRIGDNAIIAPVTLASVNVKNETSGSIDSRFQLNQTSAEKYYANSHLEQGEEYYIVAPKNTLFSIARLFGMSVDALKVENNLTSDTIRIGQRLIVQTLAKKQPAENSLYVVKEGDTMLSIAQKFELTPQQLMKMNALEGYKLYQYMVLKVK